MARKPVPIVGIEQLAAAKEVLISTGSGGVGKTTTAAAIGAMAAAQLGGKVLVLTVDPARRLANALGLARFGNTETRVSSEAFEEAGVEPRGELWVAMLDTKQSWDDLIRQHAPDAATRDAILANPLYKNITGKFIQGHDYVAMERLYEIHQSGRYDLIVVDTPPTRNAIDFLDAPDRMADFFSSRLLRWLIAPYRSRVIGLASKPFYSVADRVLGSQFLSDIAEFFILFQSMYDGFVERARAVTALLEGPNTTFVVVATLEAAPAREAEFFMRLLDQRDLPLGALVLNKVLPGELLSEEGAAAAHRILAGPSDVAASLRQALPDLEPEAIDHLDRVLVEISENFVNYQIVAKRENEQRAELSRHAAVVASVPVLDRDVADLSGLLRIGEHLWR
ncbi:MAG TPA: ArsA-related P-loop ATPase [Microthrixaceae bacterium]|nr:ArsA-related P-loop ATPase [Microthrixaceae bacterium]